MERTSALVRVSAAEASRWSKVASSMAREKTRNVPQLMLFSNPVTRLIPFAQETSFFSVVLLGFNSGSKNSSVVGRAIRDVTTGPYVGISVDGTVKSLCRAVLSRTASELARKSFF